jgi:CubicO group peptidase (beta-lactamase class C family)
MDAGVPPPLAAAVESMMRTAKVPGLSLAVVDRDGVRAARGFGAADLTAQTPATPRTQYLWFSMSKIVTATAAMALADAGRLDLDAPVHEYVEDVRAPGPKQPSTRQLLNHTSGLGNPVPVRWAHLADHPSPDPAELLRRLLSRRRAFRYPVGAQARYSNLGYLAAGAVVAAAAGETFEDYVVGHLLEPTGMSGSGYRYRSGAPAATGYVRAPRVTTPLLRRVLPAGVVGRRQGRYLSLNPFYVDGPSYGGVVGDVRDAAQFLRLHLGDGSVDGHRVLDERSARAMRVLDQHGKPFDHGIGWFRRPAGGAGDWVEHFGAGAGFWNVMRLYPERGIGVVLMTNSTTSYDFDPVLELATELYR